MNINFDTIFICLVIGLLFSGCETSTATTQETNETKIEQQNSLAVSNTTQPMKKQIEVDPTVSLERLMGKVNEKSSGDLVRVDKHLTTKEKLYVHKDCYEAFKKMHAAAKDAGVHFKIVSGFRSFKDQKSIWEAKWNGRRKVEGQDLSKTIPSPKERALKILEYSSMPGTSRHHWGTDIDLNNLENSYFESGRGLKEYEWLIANAPSFGFCQTYTSKVNSDRTGYEEEKWHWSYLPIAKHWTEQYDLRIDDSEISGFDGAASAVDIQIKEKYILGIHQSCL